jgi:hypothetical protein
MFKLLLSLALLAVAAVPAYAQRGRFFTTLRGFEEVPAIFTPAQGQFEAQINVDGTEMTYRLTYSNLRANATQAHIHFGQMGVNGGIMIWLCSNLASPPTPPGTQPCPLRSGTITGTIDMSDVVGPSGQGISAGEIASAARVIRSEVAYANVHSEQFPGGEIRGQLDFRRGRGEGDQ